MCLHVCLLLAYEPQLRHLFVCLHVCLLLAYEPQLRHLFVYLHVCLLVPDFFSSSSCGSRLSQFTRASPEIYTDTLLFLGNIQSLFFTLFLA